MDKHIDTYIYPLPCFFQIENSLDDTTEKLEAATLGLEEAAKQELVNEEEVSGLQRRTSLLDDDVARSEQRLQGKQISKTLKLE